MSNRRLSSDPMENHIKAAAIENVEWMLDQGETLERALDRAGLTVSSWEARERSRPKS